MLTQLLTGRLSIEYFISFIIALTLAMTIHEFAHNYIGYRMGDPNPQRTGRLTLNPLVHIYWPGWLMFIILGFGILGFAPIDWRRMPIENRRWRWLAAVAAGPLSNLLLALIIALILRIIGVGNLVEISRFVVTLLIVIVSVNVLLFVFNLLPLFPIDGWQIVWTLLPPDLAYTWDRYKEYTQYAFFGLLLLSFLPGGVIPNVFGLLIGQPVDFLTNLLLGF
ncbi:MAG: site-2 protease family protein [Chloroflexi bacterium]|nr:site-2 protease family protein [Chloroflexota bacterium]